MLFAALRSDGLAARLHARLGPSPRHVFACFMWTRLRGEADVLWPGCFPHTPNPIHPPTRTHAPLHPPTPLCRPFLPGDQLELQAV